MPPGQLFPRGDIIARLCNGRTCWVRICVDGQRGRQGFVGKTSLQIFPYSEKIEDHVFVLRASIYFSPTCPPNLSFKVMCNEKLLDQARISFGGPWQTEGYQTRHKRCSSPLPSSKSNLDTIQTREIHSQPLFPLTLVSRLNRFETLNHPRDHVRHLSHRKHFWFKGPKSASSEKS